MSSAIYLIKSHTDVSGTKKFFHRHHTGTVWGPGASLDVDAGGRWFEAPQGTVGICTVSSPRERTECADLARTLAHIFAHKTRKKTVFADYDPSNDDATLRGTLFSRT